ncbi:MAG TPA: LLM class flavin-dependent oxidoreductase [Jatrophihabitantaceae bacterium]|jgi:alkanesulfonate monooxygenase SsuD/methylene tetrahydromethanopterin reductase-like flavin-dependent oxidoreductase (luciferase family)
MTHPPFSRGAFAVCLAPVGDGGSEVMRRLEDEARRAEAAGFDGVTLSEHHAGFARYLPTPLVVTAHLLAVLESAWAVACPTLLPLRRPVVVAEDLAWLNAAYPGRVGAGFAAGYQRQDFDVVGADFDTRRPTFWSALRDLVKALGMAEDVSPIKADPAIADLGVAGLPLLAGVSGPRGVERAAKLCVGVLLTSLRAPIEAAELATAYREAGGQQPVVLIRRVYVGSDPVGFGASESSWNSRAEGASWLSAADGALLSGSPDVIAAGLIEAAQVSGCDALHLHLDAYHGRDSEIPDQLAMLGREVLPVVRGALGWTQ